MVLIMITCLGLILGCRASDTYGDAEPRELTTEEAERLAVVRFNNYDRHFSTFSMSLSDGTRRHWITGRLDFRGHLGYGNLTTDSDPQTFALLQWDLTTVAAREAFSQQLPADPPVTRWQTRRLEPEHQPIDTALALVLQLASDRPENPLLLRQNGARWHGKDVIEVEGRKITVDVIGGPGRNGQPSDRMLYFVDADGRLRKVIARSGPSPTVITFGERSERIARIDDLR